MSTAKTGGEVARPLDREEEKEEGVHEGKANCRNERQFMNGVRDGTIARVIHIQPTRRAAALPWARWRFPVGGLMKLFTAFHGQEQPRYHYLFRDFCLREAGNTKDGRKKQGR